MNSTDYPIFMEQALVLAKASLDRHEFPVGCVIVWNHQVVADGRRTGTIADGCNELDHAEMTALRNLLRMDPKTDRSQMTLFCTMEPCLMCFGAILLSGIRTIVYAYEDAMGGGTSCNLKMLSPLYRESNIRIIPHVLRNESLKLFQSFFGDPLHAYWRGSYLAEYTLAQSSSEERNIRHVTRQKTHHKGQEER